MFWCWERKKPQVPSVKPDPVQIDAEQRDIGNRDRTPQKFPDGYRTMVMNRWSGMIVGANLLGRQKRSHIDWYMTQLRKGRDKYKKASDIVKRNTGMYVPWEIIGVIHGLESSFNFNKQILNGQPWNKRTTWVPKGLGPWSSWEDSCVQGFLHETTHNPLPESWTIAGTALFLERWNGMGYWRMYKVSPYLWAYTSAQEAGKYVSDGKYDRNAISLQVGGMAMLKEVGFFDA